MKKVDLRKFSNTWYKPGSAARRGLWYAANAVFFKTSLPYPGKLKIFLLSLFGASIGKNITIKPSVNIKYPWFLEIGDNVWLGEGVWIDSLGKVKIGNNVCISQGAYISTGNHNYKRSTFDLMIEEVIIEPGAWIGARAVVCGGVRCGSHSVLVAGSIATSDLEPYKIYQGNPAAYKGDRVIEG